MKFRPLGSSGIEASAVGLGTWAIGGWMWGGTDEKRSIDAIHAAIDEGINLIDTAPAYGFGKSEELVGKAICDRRNRVVLATKCGQRWDIERGEYLHTEPGGRRFYRYLHPESIRTEIEQSLQRLQTDYIDLYQTHWQDSTTPIEETMECLLQLKAEGKIRAIGVCNANLEQMDRYRAVGLLDADQERFNMLDQPARALAPTSANGSTSTRRIDRGQGPAPRQDPPEDSRKQALSEEHLPYLQKNKISFITYSSLAMGLLAGKIPHDRVYPDGHVRSVHPRFTRTNRKLVSEMLGHFSPIAGNHQLTLAQLAIGWTLRQEGVTHVLVGARDAKQARENAASADREFVDEEMSTIDHTLEQYRPQIV